MQSGTGWDARSISRFSERGMLKAGVERSQIRRFLLQARRSDD